MDSATHNIACSNLISFPIDNSILSVTGDIAFRFLKYVQQEHTLKSVSDSHLDDDIPTVVTNSLDDLTHTGSQDTTAKEAAVNRTESAQSHVTVCDINKAMLNVGEKRARDQNITSG